MYLLRLTLAALFIALLQVPASYAGVKQLLQNKILGPGTPLQEVISFTGSRVPPMPVIESKADWEARASLIRQRMLDEVVFRGEASRWRKSKSSVQWMETIPGGPGYRIRKVRFEALPGLWIPALLYEPEGLTKTSGRIPVVLNVNGHDRPNGKAADYKQIRCINQARRGMLALNVEWLGMGQLHKPEYGHYLMNQLDLCGTSGLAPFYLSMSRGIDLLLAHPNADPRRVAVAGLSGGGWQTITISALDTRVTLSDPVAGYSSFLTRNHNFSDLGDSEQTPCDMATVADYSHLTAMMAPRATLLTFNATDNCCFAAGHALPPLLAAARPIFKLYGKRKNLWAHVNFSPGNHNFGRDNREALYRMFGAHFFADRTDYDAREIDVTDELKTKEQLFVTIPDNNATFVSLARDISTRLPRGPRVPSADDGPEARKQWQVEARHRLAQVIRSQPMTLGASLVDEKVDGDGAGQTRALLWKLKLGGEWTVPVVELVRGKPKTTAILLADKGRTSAASVAEELLAQGHRVIAIDPFYLGESSIGRHDFLFALTVATVGERALGLQSRQLQAVARWIHRQHEHPTRLIAVGPRTSLAALVAGGLEPGAIADVQLHDCYKSLKQVIDSKLGVNRAPELFCFGLLEQFDIPHLEALIAPRVVTRR
jgi:dienelactone hydrolase